MRIGAGLPFKDQRGLPLDAAGLGQRARRVEEAGRPGQRSAAREGAASAGAMKRTGDTA
jgi:hypothetical protein